MCGILAALSWAQAVRAYSSSAAENLDGADIRVVETCVEIAATVDYTGIDGMQKYVSSQPCSLLSTDYGEKVRFVIAVKKKDADSFCGGLVDYMQGRVQVEKGREYYGLFQE